MIYLYTITSGCAALLLFRKWPIFYMLISPLETVSQVGVDRYVFFRADTDYYRSSRPITDILNRYTCSKYHRLYWGVLQLQQRLLLLYLWETTDAWSLTQLQLTSALGVRLPSVFRVDWSDSWLSTYQMSGGRRLLSEIERSPHSHRVLSSDRLHRAK